MKKSTIIPKDQFLQELDRVFDASYNYFLGVAFDILKVREDAEDAVSNAFTHIIKRSKKRNFKGDNLKMYMSKCVHNEALKIYNQRKRRAEAEEVHESREYRAPHFAADGNITLSMIESKLELVRPYTYGVVWKMHHIEGMTYEKISEEFYLKQDHIRYCISSTNKQLRILLANYQKELSYE